MYFIILAAVALAPVFALLALLAFFLVRVDCYGGVRVLGLYLSRRPWTAPLAAVGAVLRLLG